MNFSLCQYTVIALFAVVTVQTNHRLNKNSTRSLFGWLYCIYTYSGYLPMDVSNTEHLNVPKLCCQSATRVFRGMDVIGPYSPSKSRDKGRSILLKMIVGAQKGPVNRNYENHLVILLMEEILHQFIGSLSHYLQGFLHPRWCRISSTNSRNNFIYR